MHNRHIQLFLILIALSLFIELFLCSDAHSYDAENTPVHQYITQQSQYLWPEIPSEMIDHLKNDIFTRLDREGYSISRFEDAIVGSGEEDTEDMNFCDISEYTDYLFCLLNPFSCSGEAFDHFMAYYIDRPYVYHFWNPDIINSANGFYNEGWTIDNQTKLLIAKTCFSFPFPNNNQMESNIKRAVTIWTSKVISPYISGDLGKAYYWLGRVAHLLQDLTVPAHVHDDTHVPLIDSDSYETFTASSCDAYNEGNRFNAQHFKGSNYVNQYYRHEELPNFLGSSWAQLYGSDPPNLFKLFWYTAQKTQFFASNDISGNNNYYNFDGTINIFNPSLWQGDNISVVANPDDLSSGSQITCENKTIKVLNPEVDRALIPHAMKATAGLLRLFWIETHPIQPDTIPPTVHITPGIITNTSVSFTFQGSDNVDEPSELQYSYIFQKIGEPEASWSSWSYTSTFSRNNLSQGGYLFYVRAKDTKGNITQENDWYCKYFTIGINPDSPAKLSVFPSALEFGNVLVGSTKIGYFTITNIGGGVLSGTATTNSPITVISGSPFNNIGHGQQIRVYISFTPLALSSGNRMVEFKSNGGDESLMAKGIGVSGAHTCFKPQE